MPNTMNEENTRQGQPCRQTIQATPGGIRFWFLRRWIPILSLLIIIALVIGIYLLNKNNPDLIENLQNYGYLGAFVASIILNATLVLPAGNFLVLAALGAALHRLHW